MTNLVKIGIAFIITILLFTSLPYTASAAPPEPIEEWVAMYAGVGGLGDYGRAITTDAAGNVYVSGRSSGSGTGLDIVTIKYDPSGNELWSIRYDGTGSGRDEPQRIAIDPFGMIYVVGMSQGISGTYHDGIILKYDTDGSLLWEARYNGIANDNDYLHDIKFDASGNLYVTGQSVGFGTHFDCLTLKYNSAGSLLWEAKYDGIAKSFDSGRELELDSAGNVIVAGFSHQVAWVNSDFLVIKYDSNGNQIWLRQYNAPANGNDYGWAVTLDASDNIYVTGAATGVGTDLDYTTIKYESSGVQKWISTYSGPGNSYDQAYRVLLDSADNVYITGRSIGTGIGFDYDFATVSYDPTSGAQRWAARYSGPLNGRDEAYGLVLDAFDNVYVSGQSGGGALNYDATVVGYDPSGNQLWVKRYNGPGNGDDISYVAAIDGSGNLYATGSAYIGGSDYDLLTIKYSLPAAAAATSDLITEVESLALPAGTENSLTSKLDNALTSIENDKDKTAVNQLESFQNEVSAQEGKKIDAADAGTLIDSAQLIIDNL